MNYNVLDTVKFVRRDLLLYQGEFTGKIIAVFDSFNHKYEAYLITDILYNGEYHGKNSFCLSSSIIRQYSDRNGELISNINDYIGQDVMWIFTNEVIGKEM